MSAHPVANVVPLHGQRVLRFEPAKARKKRRLPKTISRDEAGRLLAAANVRCPTGLRNRVMLELMYRAGLRVGETCALAVRDVDLAGGTIRVLDGKGGDGTAYFDPLRVGPFLELWLVERRRIVDGLERMQRLGELPLFVTLKGTPVLVRYVQQMVKRLARRAGIPPGAVTPHVLRHTFATELLDEDFDIRQIQEALRHRDLSSTEIYTHVLQPQLRDRIGRRST